MSFKEAVSLFNADEIRALSESELGLRFLKLRSLSRKEQMEAFANKFEIEISGAKSKDLLSIIFDSHVDDSQIDCFIREAYEKQREERKLAEEILLNELYKIKAFDWGGLHQNSLEKTIVDNYVKKITSYEVLNKKIDGQLLTSMRGYVLCSWYNHWTSIIIEDIFKEHKSVLPAIGLIKKVDFFVDQTPFDLKVTYLPEGYIKEERRSRGLGRELTLLKQAARRVGVAIDNTMSDSDLLEHLWLMIADHPDAKCADLIHEMSTLRNDLVNEIEDDPSNLIKWLYENQGERRFDASNRLFLVLVNEEDYFQSWQLKRNRALIATVVNHHLDNPKVNSGKTIDFVWEGKDYKAKADLILVRHKKISYPIEK